MHAVATTHLGIFYVQNDVTIHLSRQIKWNYKL